MGSSRWIYEEFAGKCSVPCPIQYDDAGKLVTLETGID
jgi:hypothetical protein